MFQRSKTSYNIVAFCKNGDNQATYSFIENYDEHWGDIASSYFTVNSEPNRLK